MPTRFEDLSYGPEATKFMREAFEEAWRLLDLLPDVANVNRALLASAVLDAFNSGVRDRQSLIWTAVRRVRRIAPAPIRYPEDSARWRDRAEEVRTLGEHMREPTCRMLMLSLASEYERRADLSEKMF